MNKGWLYILAICLLLAAIVGGYWVAKHGSYWLWYEDMVIQTIHEQVKPEFLQYNTK